MRAINFFNPVYIVPAESKSSSKAERISFKQWVVNVAESTFALGNAYKVSKISISNGGKQQLVDEYKKGYRIWVNSLIRVIALVAIVAASVFFPPLIILPASLLMVKLLHRYGYRFESKASNIQKNPPNPVLQSIIDDELMVKNICKQDLILLKEDGPLYKKFQAQVEIINQKKDSQLGATLYSRLGTYQAYYAAMLDNPDFADLNERICEAVESIGRLKSSIDYNIRGIINVGNSCYINSTMQSLLTIPEINQKIAVLDEMAFEGTHREIARALKKIVAVYNLDCAPDEAMINASEDMQQALLNAKLIPPAPDKSVELEATIQSLESFGFGSEEDVVLEEMRSELEAMRAANVNYIIKAQGDPIDLIAIVMELIGDTIPLVRESYASGINSAVEKKNEINTPYLLIPLDDTDEILSFKNLLYGFFAPREKGEGKFPKEFELQDGGQLFADRWAKVVRIRKEPPPYLVVQLNRVIVEGGEQKRLNTAVDLKAGETLDLSGFFETPQSALYEACAVISQNGDVHQGHYTAIRKDAESKWYDCNDHRLNVLENKEINQQLGLGCIYFLQRKVPNLEDVNEISF